jgi:hypothetical protein
MSGAMSAVAEKRTHRTCPHSAHQNCLARFQSKLTRVSQLIDGEGGSDPELF